MLLVAMAGCALASTAEEAIRIAGPDRFANLGKTCESEFTELPMVQAMIAGALDRSR